MYLQWKSKEHRYSTKINMQVHTDSKEELASTMFQASVAKLHTIYDTAAEPFIKDYISLPLL